LNHPFLLKPETRNNAKPFYPFLFQINTRVWLTELSGDWDGRQLDDIPDDELDDWPELTIGSGY
jgi:hypothetical protein